MVANKAISKLFPFKPNKLTLSSGHSLHYVDEGEGDVMLCVHGNPTWSFYYRQVVERFRDSMRVIAVDHLGCGLSDKPQDYSYTLENHISNLTELINDLGLKSLTLVGHDWGGAIGLGWAVRHPEKLDQVVILNSSAFFSKDVPKRISFCKVPIIGPFILRRLNAFARAASYLCSHHGLKKSVRQGLLHPYNSYKNRIAVAGFVQDIPGSPKHPTFGTIKEIEEGLKQVTCPMLLLWGMRDFCFHSGFLARWIEFFPEARVERFPDAGHYLLEDEPTGVLRAIQGFLSPSHLKKGNSLFTGIVASK